MNTFQIERRTVGPGHPALIVAEVAQAHDGSLGAAHAHIDAAAAAGADAVKFQTHIAAEESTPDEPWRLRFSPQDDTRFAYWKRMEFTEAQWLGLARHARERGLIFLSSPFSVAAVELLRRVGVPAWKVGAGEVSTPDLLEAMLGSGEPVLLSNGMSTWAELDRAVGHIRARGAPFALFQCTTAYPCPPEKLGLNVLGELRRRYACPVGLSDHSGTIAAGLAAATLGANLIEVHVTFSRQSFGPDVPASLTFDELSRLVEGVRFIERALSHPVDKDAMAAELEVLRQTFRKKVVARRSLPEGTMLAPEDVVFRKAGEGMAADRVQEVLGRRLRRDVAENTAIKDGDLEP